MRRALTAITGTTAALAALLSFKSASTPRRAARLATPGTTAAASAPSPSPSGAAPAPTATAEKTVTGPVEDNRYGPVQVEVTVRGSTLLDVQAVQLPSDRRRSAEISDQAAPILRQETLAAQSGHIDLVSGATYTSEGYAQSLQAALDAARQ
jgi:uncharacterized protein with FMN-binding domain